MPRPILPEVMKARAGVPTSDLLAQLWAKKLQGYSVTTIIGIPPLSFKADGTPLISWSMKGNGVQSGTPTPDAPIMPEFVGVRTENLLDKTAATGVAAAVEQIASGIRVITESGGYAARIILAVQKNTDYTLSYIWRGISGSAVNTTRVFAGAESSTEIAKFEYTTGGTFNTGNNTIINIWFYAAFGAKATVEYTNIMFNIGSTPLSYEPFGWAEKITCAGQTVPVYLGEVPTVRRIKKLVLTGEEPGWTYIEDGKHWAPVYLYQKSGLMCICTHYVAVANGSGSGFIANGQVGFYSSAANRLIFCNTNYTSTDDWKSYLATQYAAGTPVTVWYVLATPETAIVNEPLCKIGAYADELHSADASVTIPTANGENVLTVDTTIQPSEMSITGHIKQA